MPENMLESRGNMQTKVICNAKINGKRSGCSVLVCENNKGNVFCIFEINYK
jgi:hypothetical protein